MAGRGGGAKNIKKQTNDLSKLEAESIISKQSKLSELSKKGEVNQTCSRYEL